MCDTGKCYYNNNTVNGTTYGKLYNWYAVAGIYNTASLTNPLIRKKLAPTGWHVPTQGEWVTLTNCLGGQYFAGGKMKTTGTLEQGNGVWQSPNTAATNQSGFTGLPGGFCTVGGNFGGVGFQCIWWSSSESIDDNAWGLGLNFDDNTARNERTSGRKFIGYSVRCVKD